MFLSAVPSANSPRSCRRPLQHPRSLRSMFHNQRCLELTWTISRGWKAFRLDEGGAARQPDYFRSCLVRRNFMLRGYACVVFLCACHSHSLPASKSDSAVVPISSLDTGGSSDAAGDGGTGRGEVCNDGTGAMDCCPAGTVSGGDCPVDNLTCYSQCAFPTNTSTQGTRTGFYCSSGTWLAGHGLFPCARQ